MTHNITITEEERQVLVQGLAWIAEERPGWIPAFLLPLVAKLSDPPMFETFRTLRREEIAADRGMRGNRQ